MRESMNQNLGETKSPRNSRKNNYGQNQIIALRKKFREAAVGYFGS